jgi:uncharacterized protein (TIGR02001 family)
MQWGRRRLVGLAAFVAALTCLLAEDARAQRTDAEVSSSINIGARGGPAAGGPARRVTFEERAAGAFDFSAGAGIASDYVYRGVSLSNRKPVIGAAFEAAIDKLYASGTVTTVRAPSQPTAELTFGGGVRPKLGPIDIDLGVTYFAYPGEIAGVSTEYWEFLARGDTKLTDRLRAAAGFAISPNVSKTGAWSKFAAAGLGLELPASLLPDNVTAIATGGAGYFWFGKQKDDFGGFPLPSYVTWNAGVTLGFKNLHLDLRYFDTNLSKENCYVFTGDPNAASGGRINPLTNPDGLTSRWCSATVVAKFWFSLN